MSVHPSKTPGKWDVRYRDPATGKNRSRTFPTKAAARKFDASITVAKADDELLDADKAAMTVGQFFEQKFLPKKQVSRATKAIWGYLWGAKDPANDKPYHLRKQWGDVKLRDANNREAVLDWIDAMADVKEESRPAAAYGLLVNIITFAVSMDYLSHSKVGGLVVEYEPKETGDPWLPVDIEAVRADILHRGENPPRGYGGAKRATYGWRRQRDALAVSIMGYLALRMAECWGLQWPMLLERDERGRWQVRTHVTITNRISRHGDPENRTKTSRTKRTPRAQRKPRIVEIDETVRNEIRDWWIANGQPNDGYVLPIDPADRSVAFGAAQMTNWGRTIWHKSVRNVGLLDVPPKHLRLSCVSMWLREGRDEGSAAAAAGHSTKVMWSTYHKALTARMGAKQKFDMAAAIEAARSETQTGVRRTFGIVAEGGR